MTRGTLASTTETEGFLNELEESWREERATIRADGTGDDALSDTDSERGGAGYS